MSTKRNPALWRGIVGVVVLVVIAITVVVLSRVTWEETTYQAQFAQTAGLQVGESVEIAGVEVGTVRSMGLDGQHIDVMFTVKDSIHLGSQTTAAIKVATLLGTHYLAIAPVGSGQLSGNTIALANTTVPYSLQDVLNNSTDQLQQLNSADLAKSLSVVADALRKSAPQLAPALDGITRFSRVITAHDASFSALLDASKTVSQQFANSGGQLVKLMSSGNQIIAEILQRRAAIHDLLVNVTALSHAVEGVIHDVGTQLSPTLADIHMVMTILEKNQKALARTLHELAVSARYTANATGNGPWLDLYSPQGMDPLSCLEGTLKC